MSDADAWQLWFAWWRDLLDEDPKAAERMAWRFVLSIPEVRQGIREFLREGGWSV